MVVALVLSAGVIGGGLYVLATRGGDGASRGRGGASPEETVEAFVLADVEGDCVTFVDLTTQHFRTWYWGVSTREEALARCEETPVAERSDIPDDLQVTHDTALLFTEDGFQATVTRTIVPVEESPVRLDYLLVMVDGEWQIDDVEQ